MKSSAPNSVKNSRLLRLLLCIAAAWTLAACAASAVARQPRMSDPLLGVGYDTAKVKFESLPAETSHKAELGDQPQWIYARNGELIIVSGFLRIESDDPAHKSSHIEPDFGAVLRDDGSAVKVLGVPDLLFGDPPLVSEAERAPLLADAVQRYIKAWGGKQKLQQALRDFDDPSVVPAPLRAALQAQGLVVGAEP